MKTKKHSIRQVQTYQDMADHVSLPRYQMIDNYQICTKALS